MKESNKRYSYTMLVMVMIAGVGVGIGMGMMMQMGAISNLSERVGSGSVWDTFDFGLLSGSSNETANETEDGEGSVPNPTPTEPADPNLGTISNAKVGTKGDGITVTPAGAAPVSGIPAPTPGKLEGVSRILRTPRPEEEEWGTWKTRDCSALAQDWVYTAPHTLRGYHVVCFNPISGSDKALKMTAYVDGSPTGVVKGVIPATTLGTFRAEVQAALKIRAAFPMSQPWRMFNNQGRVIEDLDGLEQLVLVYEGGQWIWPAIEVGHKWVIENLLDDAPDLVVETVAVIPHVFSVTNFITLDECDYIIELSKPHLFQSGVAHFDDDIGKDSAIWRTSSQAWLASTTPPLKFLDHRIAELVRVPESHGEATQILEYKEGQRYVAHVDAFDTSRMKQSPELVRAYQGGAKNRLATVFEYHTTVRNGGWTVFPRAGGLPQPHDFEDCSKGLRVAPVKGSVVVFYSLDATGAIDEYSLHGGCAPLRGEDGGVADVKRSANKWVWNQPMTF